MVVRKLPRNWLFLLLCMLASSVQAAPVQDPTAGTPQWISLKTEHFEIYTTNSEQQARETLEVLENVRAFFSQTTTLIRPDSKPIRIIALRSREEYAPFRLQSTSFAHYLHSRRGDYIVLQDILPEHHRAAIHEYTHFVFRTAGLELPIWLCEGTADFYSSLRTRGDRYIVGGVLSSRYRNVNGDSLLPFSILFAVDHASSFYNEPDKVAAFYAESWALVHMLAFHPQYRAHFPEYLRVVSSGASSEDAFELVFHKSTSEAAADLGAYLPLIATNESVSPVAAVDHQTPSIKTLSDVEASLAMADVLAAHRSTAKQAKDRLEQLGDRLAENRAQAKELLDYLAAQEPATSH